MIERATQDAQTYRRREMLIGVLETTVDSAVTPIMEGDRVAGVVLELSDATRPIRIRHENELMLQRDTTRLMMRQLAHEIRNPLGGLRGAAQLLDRALPDSEMREYTDVIIAEADRLVTLTEGLLGPGGPPRREHLNVHEVLQRVISVIEGELSSGVSIIRDYDPSLPGIPLDRDQMIQTLLNLARNALQAVGAEGRIVLRTRALAHSTIHSQVHRLAASIEVEDDGPGIDEALRETLFYPLVSGRVEGSGLGLSIAQELVNRHGGLIEFESRPGRTVFRVVLPMGEEDAG